MRRDEGRREGGKEGKGGGREEGGVFVRWEGQGRVEGGGGRSKGMRGKGHYKNVPPLVSNLHAFSNLCSPQ